MQLPYYFTASVSSGSFHVTSVFRISSTKDSDRKLKHRTIEKYTYFIGIDIAVEYMLNLINAKGTTALKRRKMHSHKRQPARFS